MSTPKLGISKKSLPMHYSVGAVIVRDGKYLLIDRSTPPFGYASVAGHVDEGETPEFAIVREVKEESGLDVTSTKQLFEEELDWNTCSRGIGVHYWYVFQCEVEGEITQNEEETKSIGWFTSTDIEGKTLEPVWKYWFSKMNIL